MSSSSTSPLGNFTVHLNVFDIELNFKDKYLPDLSCTISKQGKETLDDTLQCPRLPDRKARETLRVGSVLNRCITKQLKRWVKFLKFYLSMKEVFSD